MFRLSRPSPSVQWILMLCVPLMALSIVGRQIYLRSHYGLSAWKGGGMGMFASTDELSNRYAKVFLIEPNGERNPLVQLSPEDSDVLNRALEFPTRKNFLRAARQIAQRNWIAAYQRRPVLKVNSDGNPIDAGATSYRVMVPSELKPETEKKRPSMEIQFWKLSYDPQTRQLRAAPVENFSFSAQELVQPPDQKNS